VIPGLTVNEPVGAAGVPPQVQTDVAAAAGDAVGPAVKAIAVTAAAAIALRKRIVLLFVN